MRIKHTLSFGSFVFLCLFLIIIFKTELVHATLPSISISLSNTIVSLSIESNHENGTFAESNSINISANTNNYSGYTLSISSSTNNASLTGPLNTVSGTNEVLNSIGTISGVTSTGISQSDFSNSSNTQYNDTWGYKPSKRNSSDNTNFLPAPSTSGDVIDSTSVANPNNTPNDYTMSIGARITPATQPGAYSNTFVITAVANLINYSIAYDANDGNSGQDTTNMPASNPQTGSIDTTTTTVTLSDRTPVRDGYDFMGWCTVQVADDAACSGTEYQPSGLYTIDYINSNTIALYARWRRAAYNLTINFAGTGVTSVKICAVSGNCSGNDLKGTISTSGDYVSGLIYNTAYYLYPSFSSGYILDNWSKTSLTGILSSISSNNPTFTIGIGHGAVTITGKEIPRRYLISNGAFQVPLVDITDGNMSITDTEVRFLLPYTSCFRTSDKIDLTNYNMVTAIVNRGAQSYDYGINLVVTQHSIHGNSTEGYYYMHPTIGRDPVDYDAFTRIRPAVNGENTLVLDVSNINKSAYIGVCMASTAGYMVDLYLSGS